MGEGHPPRERRQVDVVGAEGRLRLAVRRPARPPPRRPPAPPDEKAGEIPTLLVAVDHSACRRTESFITYTHDPHVRSTPTRRMTFAASADDRQRVRRLDPRRPRGAELQARRRPERRRTCRSASPREGQHASTPGMRRSSGQTTQVRVLNGIPKHGNGTDGPSAPGDVTTNGRSDRQAVLEVCRPLPPPRRGLYPGLVSRRG
jgi:hypothetical protein